MKPTDLAAHLSAFLKDSQAQVPSVSSLRLYKRKLDFLFRRFDVLMSDNSDETKERLIGCVGYIAACQCKVDEVEAYAKHLMRGTRSQKVLDIMTDLFSSLDALKREFPHVTLSELSKELKDAALKDVFDREVSNFLKRLSLVIHYINELHFDIEQDLLHSLARQSVSDEGLPTAHGLESTKTAPIVALKRLIEPFSLVESDIVKHVRSQLSMRFNLLIKYLLREYKQDIACQFVSKGEHLSDFLGRYKSHVDSLVEHLERCKDKGHINTVEFNDLTQLASRHREAMEKRLSKIISVSPPASPESSRTPSP